MLCFPEIRLKRICDTLLQYIITDYNRCIEEGNEKISYLYLLFHEESDVEVISQLYEQAVQVLIKNREDSNPRKLEVFPIFKPNRAGLPSIFITCPQDSDNFRQLGDEDGDEEMYKERLAPRLSRGFRSQFGIITTSDNIMEVLIINYVLRAMLIGSISDLSELGFINPEFQTQELNIRPNILPDNVYMKGLLMTTDYIDSFPDVETYKSFKNIIFILDKIKY